MVTLNGTVFVELILFLVFLWGTNRFVFRPIFRVMDEREAAMERDRAVAETMEAEAESLEAAYREEITAARRATNERMRNERHSARNAQLDRIQERRRQADAEVEAVRAEAMKRVDEQRKDYERYVPGIVDAIEEAFKLREFSQ